MCFLPKIALFFCLFFKSFFSPSLAYCKIFFEFQLCVLYLKPNQPRFLLLCIDNFWVLLRQCVGNQSNELHRRKIVTWSRGGFTPIFQFSRKEVTLLTSFSAASLVVQFASISRVNQIGHVRRRRTREHDANELKTACWTDEWSTLPLTILSQLYLGQYYCPNDLVPVSMQRFSATSDRLLFHCGLLVDLMIY